MYEDIIISIFFLLWMIERLIFYCKEIQPNKPLLNLNTPLVDNNSIYTPVNVEPKIPPRKDERNLDEAPKPPRSNNSIL